jgi:hypothetical protein
MSINDAERRRTADELTSLRQMLPVTDEQLARRLGYGTDRLAEVIVMSPGVDPREGWRVRDFMLAVAEAHGITPPCFSLLKQSKRAQAQLWFGAWEVPEAGDLGRAHQ